MYRSLFLIFKKGDAAKSRSKKKKKFTKILLQLINPKKALGCIFLKKKKKRGEGGREREPNHFLKSSDKCQT
jgi:hypothetical protein